MAKARVGLYDTSGETLRRTHLACPKCGAGTFLAEHSDRRSCGRCGYSESKAPPPSKTKAAKGAPPPRPATPES